MSRIWIDRAVFALAGVLMLLSVVRYTSGVFITLGYRSGLLPLSNLPAEMQHWLPGIPLWQDVIYVVGYLGVVAALALLLMRRGSTLIVYAVSAGIAKLDWAFLGTTPEPIAITLGWSAFIQYFVILTLLLVMTRRGYFRQRTPPDRPG